MPASSSVVNEVHLYTRSNNALMRLEDLLFATLAGEFMTPDMSRSYANNQQVHDDYTHRELYITTGGCPLEYHVGSSTSVKNVTCYK